MSDSLQPHGLQHTSLPCPLPSPGVCSNSCPLSQWFNPTISSSVTPFSSYPQSFPASGCFPMSWLFTSRGQSIAASSSVSLLPVNSQGWFPWGLTGLISLLFKELSRVFSNTTIWKYQFQHSAFFTVQLFATPWTVAHQASLSFTISWSLLKFMSTELVLSELSTVTCPSWVALHGMAHSFIELSKPLYHDEAVISYEWFMMLYGRNQHNIVKQLSSN